MKLKLITFLFLLSATFVNAQNVVWHTDFNKAMEESNKTKKPLLLFFTGSDWCGWCVKLNKEVFLQPEFEKWAKKNVVLMELDFPRRSTQDDKIKMQNIEIQKAFSVRGYPTIWFVNASLENSKVNFTPIGSVGYVAGGPEKWLESAKLILANKK